MNRHIIRAIDVVLADWAKLTDTQKGPLYKDAVKSLESFKANLEAEELTKTSAL